MGEPHRRKSSGWWLKVVAAPAAFVTQPSFDLRRQQHDTIITSIMPKPDFRLVDSAKNLILFSYLESKGAHSNLP
jgi:hypothetical protein